VYLTVKKPPWLRGRGDPLLSLPPEGDSLPISKRNASKVTMGGGFLEAGGGGCLSIAKQSVWVVGRGRIIAPHGEKGTLYREKKLCAEKGEGHH